MTRNIVNIFVNIEDGGPFRTKMAVKYLFNIDSSQILHLSSVISNFEIPQRNKLNLLLKIS